MLNMRRERTSPVLCPFCRAEIPRPEELEGIWYEFDGGACTRCGASFAVDPTARNGGAVLTQALVQACGGDWDKALSLGVETDFEEAHLTHYDTFSHRLRATAFATIYFIRLHPESSAADQDA